MATQVKQKAEAHLSARHAGERLMRVWGGQAGLQHSETKQSISNMIKVHLLPCQVSGLHCPPCRACLRGLHCPTWGAYLTAYYVLGVL